MNTVSSSAKQVTLDYLTGEPSDGQLHPLYDVPSNLKRRKITARVFEHLFKFSTYGLIAILLYLIGDVLADGWKWLSLEFLDNFASRYPSRSGIKAALFGSLWLISLTALFSIPVGVAAGIYLEELMAKSRLNKFITLNIQNLAGVPSIVYGILGLGLFVRFFNFDRSILSGALTLALLILPIIIIATREALKAIPNTIRHAALSLGATKWQAVRSHVLPAALPSILTGVILSVSRAIGETAPLIVVGAVAYIRFTPETVMDSYTALPIQIYNWVGKPKAEFHELAAAGIIVLLAVLLITNSIAILIRNSRQRINI